MNRNYGHRGGSSVFIAIRPSGADHSDEPFKPLNLTYSLVKELPEFGPDSGQSVSLSESRRTRVRMSSKKTDGKLIRVRLEVASPFLVGDLGC